MTVLVTAASKHRSTLEIAQAIARELADHGVATDLREPDDIHAVTPYSAVIIGSGVYAGQWLAPARQMIERCAAQLRERPVWLFSSGPMGDPPAPAGDPAGVAPLIDLIHPRAHRVFGGRLEKSELGIGEKLIITAVRAPYGDYRDWAEIKAWADEVAAELAVAADATRHAPVPA